MIQDSRNHFLELGYGDSKYPIHFIELIYGKGVVQEKKNSSFKTTLETLERTVFAPVNHFETPSVHKNLKLNDLVLVDGNAKLKLLC
ncbi:hypothetical protein TNIN_241111 [Trichonephila inaurata madagascariensis]|uniref:Uncharacterized protein n=1 Tax=Trichonephila inaurata madagascariensis TaxID=2747483 RepID=A0A8X6IDX3_9ARAC|nr:hypothetical protein TNIN_241111 [Trichonephila inaurata madagascariensis]